MDNLRLEINKPAPTPMVNAWLNPTKDGFELVLKHSDDASDQRLFHFELFDGKIQILMQEICTKKLCDALGIEQKSTPPIRDWGSRSIVFASQGRANPDKLPAGVVLPESPDWADKLANEWKETPLCEALGLADFLRTHCQPREVSNAPELLEHAVLDVAELEYYINNPSAWDSFDEGMSELLRKVVTRAKAAIAKATQP
jgi:hypothetical protein